MIRAAITLHVGYGTFKPIRTDASRSTSSIRSRTRSAEETAAAIAVARADGRRVIAVGTTTTRTLEDAARAR